MDIIPFQYLFVVYPTDTKIKGCVAAEFMKIIITKYLK